MRKVIESTLVSLNGVIGDPMTWANGYFGKQAQEIALAQLLVSDALLMGRHTYEMFATTSEAGTGAFAAAVVSPSARWFQPAFVSAGQKDGPETGLDQDARARRRHSHLLV